MTTPRPAQRPASPGIMKWIPRWLAEFVYWLVGTFYLYWFAVMTLRPGQAWNIVRQYRQQVRFALVGFAVYLVGNGILYWGIAIQHLPSWQAYVADTVISVALNFLLSRYYTWRDVMHEVPFWRSLWMFVSFRLISIGLNQVLFNFQVGIGIPYILANTACVIVAMGFNYSANNEFTFKVKTAPPGRPPLPKGLITPPVSVVIPVKGGNVYETVTRLQDQLYAAYSQLGVLINLRIILVGDMDDAAFGEDSVPEEIRVPDAPWLRRIGISEMDPLVWMIGVGANFSGPRDAQLKRQVGQKAAAARTRNLSQAEADRAIIVANDSDVLPDVGWLEWALYRMLVEGYEFAAGALCGTGDSFWDCYIDKATNGKTPRVERAFHLTAQSVGSRKPPVTAGWAFNGRVLRLTGGADPGVQYSYEDYSFVARAFRAVPGLVILMDPNLLMRREHRVGYKKLSDEHFRAGQGCHGFMVAHPDSLFSTLRLIQLTLIPVAAVAAGIGAWQFPQAAVVLALAALLSQMLSNLLAARKWYAVIFPVISTIFTLRFVAGVCHRFTTRRFRGYRRPGAIVARPFRNTPDWSSLSGTIQVRGNSSRK